MRQKLGLVVLVSGSGSNLQAIIDRAQSGEINIEVIGVISDKASAFGLERAAKAGIATAILEATPGEGREEYDRRLLNLVEEQFSADLVVLAGFMRILSDHFVNHFLGRMLNIHPSLLPKYRGLHTHQRALEAGDSEAGCSVHFVTPELDSGPLIIQQRVPIEKGDTPESLASRVLKQEHQIYSQAIGWFADGRLKCIDGQARLDGQPIVIGV